MAKTPTPEMPLHDQRIVIPPYSNGPKRRSRCVTWYVMAAEHLTNNGLLTMMLLVISCGLLTAAVMSHVYGPPVFAWLYVPVYTVCGPFMAWVILNAFNASAKPTRDYIRRMKRGGDTSEFDDATYERVLASLKSMSVPNARKVLHENRDSAQAYSRVYSKSLEAAWKRGMETPEAKHYAHHLAMLTYPGAAESELASQIIVMIEDRGLVTDADLITGILATEVPPLTSGQL